MTIGFGKAPSYMHPMPDSIAERLNHQRQRLADAAHRAGRDPLDVTLIAVSKKQSVDAIRQAYAAGQRDFGENYVQELVLKAKELASLFDIRWHMIGHLQSNKARLVVPLVHRVHTVSGVKLARELGARAAQSPHVQTEGKMKVLIEVNVSGELSKGGCTALELPQILAELAEQTSIQATGLMTMPPASDDASDARFYFDRLFELRERFGGAASLPELSMGMSHDAEEAVAAGATYVRIGSAIFGSRPS